MKRTPLKKKRDKPRRQTLPRCAHRGCKQIARLYGWCISHADSHAWTMFSKYIRRRDGRCTAAGLGGFGCTGVLQAAHIIGRNNKTLKFDPRNVHAACAGHHRWLDSSGREGHKRIWATRILGEEGYDQLCKDSLVFTDRVATVEAALSWLKEGQE